MNDLLGLFLLSGGAVVVLTVIAFFKNAETRKNEKLAGIQAEPTSLSLGVGSILLATLAVTLFLWLGSM